MELVKPAATNEVYISVDIESSGAYPGQYALLSIGACTLYKPRAEFYIELKPDVDAYQPEAMAIHGLSLEKLAQDGIPPAEAMKAFEDWVLRQAPAGMKPVFVAFNAGFDWMFVNYYFLRYLGRNPFGHSALDIKSFYMGCAGVSFSETGMRAMGKQFPELQPLTHNALEDAAYQGDLFINLCELVKTAKKVVDVPEFTLTGENHE